MMKTLFRGKDAYTGELVYGFLVDFGNGDCGIISGFTSSDYSFIRVIPETVGQYTGFTDMNGVKIFVGDITEIEYGGWKVRREIVFSQGACQYLNSGGLSPMPMRYIIKDFNTFYGVVIGNIHDNPEVTE